MRALLESITDEYRRYKALAEAALEQVPEAALSEPGPAGGNSLAVICWHMAGNLRSRFTDFLTSDGEKTNRNRDGEFEAEAADTRQAITAAWTRGWDLTLGTIASLAPEDLHKTVHIRAEAMSAMEAIHRQMLHYAEHAGQIILLAKHFAGERWQTLSIPKRRRL